MTLEYVLGHYHARLSVGDKWMIKHDSRWEVYQQRYGQRVKVIEDSHDL